jgi:glutamate dehydrogenase
VLLAYTKIVLADDLLDSDLPDDPFMRTHLFTYFPTAMRQGYRDRMDAHPLRREIVVTQVVNHLVNQAGITFFHRLSGETGASADELARAHAIASEIYGAEALYRLVQGVDHQVDAAVQTRMRLDVRQLVERATRWLVNQRWHSDAERAVEQVGTAVQEVVRGLPETLAGREHDRLQARAEHLRASGVPDELALRVAALPTAYSALAVVEVARRLGREPLEVARVHSALGQRLNMDVLYDRVVGLPRNDRWQTMARATLRDDLQQVHAAITAKVLETGDPARTEGSDAASVPADEVAARIEAWVDREDAVFERALVTLGEICRDESPDLARLSVGLRVARTLLG